MVGITFEPHRGRRVPDVRGTVWLDAHTFELRFVEFQFSRLPAPHVATRDVRGEVHFRGCAAVRGLCTAGLFACRSSCRIATRGSAPLHRGRPRSDSSRKVGSLSADGLRLFKTPGVLTGVVVDSVNLPLAGANVRLAGSGVSVPVDASGRFRFDSVPPAVHVFLVEHGGYAALGIFAADQVVQLRDGETRRSRYARHTRATSWHGSATESRCSGIARRFA